MDFMRTPQFMGAAPFSSASMLGVVASVVLGQPRETPGG
jgi:hypothetical protein